MKQLAALTAFLISLDLVAAEQIDSWADTPVIVPSGKVISDNSILLYRLTYNGIFTIERYPHKQHSAYLLFGQVGAWLMDNEPARNNGTEATIQTEIDILDDGTADIIFTIDFWEEVTAITDPNGVLVINNQHYTLADAEIDVAESGEVTNVTVQHD